VTRALFVAVLSLFLVAGCNGGEEEALETDVPTPTVSTINEVRVYFLRAGTLEPALREVPRDTAQANAALERLFAGPTAAEVELGMTTALPDDVGPYSLLAAPGQRPGAVSMEFGSDLTRAARAQLVFTLTQFPLIEAVILGSETYRRADFEDLSPAILVESPLAFEEVPPPLHAFGTASTFEATFAYELLDAEGDVLDEDFVTATSGSGTRGRFQFVAPFEVDAEEEGSLVVFEQSGEDGSRINVVEIPLRLTP
jgi:germination protein M